MARGMRCGLRSWWQLAWRGPSSGREGAGGHQGSSSTPPDRRDIIILTPLPLPLYAPAITLLLAVFSTQLGAVLSLKSFYGPSLFSRQAVGLQEPRLRLEWDLGPEGNISGCPILVPP